MNTVNFHTAAAPRRTTWAKALGLATLAAAAWGLSAGSAQARGSQDDVYWSIGVNSPGVSVGVSNAPPPREVVVRPRPVVIHQPAPVVIQQPYAYVRPVVVHPRPVVYHGWGHGPRWDDRRHWQHRHHHDRYDRDDRHGRGDDRWDDNDDRGGRRGDGRR